MWSIQLDREIKTKERIKRNFILFMLFSLFIITYSITWLKKCLISKIIQIKVGFKRVKYKKSVLLEISEETGDF